MKDEIKKRRPYKRRDTNLFGLILATKLQLDAMTRKAIPKLVRERDIINAMLRELGYVDDPNSTVIDIPAVATEEGAAEGEQRVPIAARRLTTALLTEKLALERRVQGTRPSRRKPGNTSKHSGAKTYGPHVMCKKCGMSGHDGRSHIHDGKKKAGKK